MNTFLTNTYGYSIDMEIADAEQTIRNYESLPYSYQSTQELQQMKNDLNNLIKMKEQGWN